MKQASGRPKSTFDELWPKLREGRRFRAAFVAAHAKRAIGLQIRALMKQHNFSQTDIADRGNVDQSSVSRAVDDTNDSITLKTLVRIAAGFDVAFVGRFVPFSELPKWFDRLYSDDFSVATFDEEDAALEQEHQTMTKRALTERNAGNVTRLDDYILTQLKEGGQRRSPKRSPEPTKPTPPRASLLPEVNWWS